MESEKDAVIRRAREYGKRHLGIINPDAEIMQEVKVKKRKKDILISHPISSGRKKGVPTFNAQKVLDNQCTRKHLFNDSEKENKKHRSMHSSRTKSLMRNEILYMWLKFLEAHSKSSKGLAELRANFMDALFEELGI
jgi:hypothetical protein